MQVRCPNCSTAYEIPPPVRPCRLRCARCETEWRALPPEADPVAAGAAAPPIASPASVEAAAAGVGTPVAVATPVEPGIVPDPGAAVFADALGMSVSRRTSAVGLMWLLAWLLSLAVIAGAMVVAWHGRVSIEHAWPRALWLFRLLPGGVPV